MKKEKGREDWGQAEQKGGVKDVLSRKPGWHKCCPGTESKKKGRDSSRGSNHSRWGGRSNLIGWGVICEKECKKKRKTYPGEAPVLTCSLNEAELRSQTHKADFTLASEEKRGARKGKRLRLHTLGAALKLLRDQNDLETF